MTTKLALEIVAASHDFRVIELKTLLDWWETGFADTPKIYIEDGLDCLSMIKKLKETAVLIVYQEFKNLEARIDRIDRRLNRVGPSGIY